MTTVLELRGITKSFPGVLANDHIDLTLEQGEIHALLGENGAGKTTLMNILYGLYKPDSGEIVVGGKAAEIHSPNDAIALGVGMVHQHFMLVPVMTVTENVMLGVEPTHAGSLSRSVEGCEPHPRDFRGLWSGSKSQLLRQGPVRRNTADASRSSRSSTGPLIS